MIPKIIHYCWFGRGEMGQLAHKCIDSWKKFLPDYELMLWNEDSFDLDINPYTKEAYEKRKFAFITDYVRLWALKNYGGVYMDTDVEVLKNIDEFLVHKAFSGFENEVSVPTGLMASEKGGQWVSELLDYYTDRHFILPDGTLDLTTNVRIITDHILLKGFVPNGEYQEVADMVAFYPKDYFCAKNEFNGKVTITGNTHTIHRFAGSWLAPRYKFKKRVVRILMAIGIYYPARGLYRIFIRRKKDE